ERNRSPMRNVLMAALLPLVAACQSMHGDGPKESARREPTKRSPGRGNATFVQHGDKVHVMASVSGLKPNGEFGFHVHEAGDCSSGDGMRTKGHFNPHNKPHAQAGV